MRVRKAIRGTVVCASAAIVGTVLGMCGFTVHDPAFWVVDVALVLLILAS